MESIKSGLFFPNFKQQMCPFFAVGLLHLPWFGPTSTQWWGITDLDVEMNVSSSFFKSFFAVIKLL